MALLDLQTLAEVEAMRRGKPLPKPMPHMIAKQERKKTKDQLAKDFRDAVWARDKGRSRATGKPLSASAVDWDRRGEVDHAVPRSLAPERLYDVSNGILLSVTENRMRKVPCVNAPEHKYFDYRGPDDRSQPQTFTWRDAEGKVTKQRIG